MRSLRTKLIAVVLVIAFSGLVAVVYSSLYTVRDSERESNEVVNRQIAELISKSVMARVGDYRKQLEFIFNAWHANSQTTVQTTVFPDYLWIAFFNLKGEHVFEWTNSHELSKVGLNADSLLGRRRHAELFDEIKYQFRESKRWIIFNSTVQTITPTFLLGTMFTKSGESEPSIVALVEIKAEALYASVQGRKDQDLILVDSHQNILLSTKERWDPSDLAFNDDAALKQLSEMNEGQRRFVTLEYKDREPQVTSLFKFKDGGGLSLLLQQSLSEFRASENRIQIRSMLIAFVVLVVTINLLVFIASSITSPLMQLMKAMEKVGKGEFSGKIKVKSKDEIGRLATMFNKMILELKQREEEIERAKASLIQSEKMSAFGQMSAGIAHEVKNPLAGILGYAQMSKKKLPADSDVLPYVEIIEKETVRCKEIVDNLMRFARQEKAAMVRIDINKTVKDSIRLVEHQMGISGIKIVQMLALDGAPIWIRGNSNQIQQVMMNLMLNAQQAMEGKGTLTISTHFDAENQKVLVMVSDTGAGMTPEVKNRIFEPFFTTKGVGKGTGLGLSVSIGIVNDHGGAIEVESTVGKGTTFTISLPCDRQSDAPSDEKRDEKAEAKPEKGVEKAA